MTIISGLSIIIPAYNEAESIQDTVAAVLQDIPPSIDDVELILVDDGSVDETGTIIDDLSASNRLIHAIHHPVNLGKGAALLSGFGRACKEWVLILDADGQIGIRELSAFLAHSGQHDIIIGYRTDRRQSAPRKIVSWCYKKLTAHFLGITVKDVGCPFKLFRKAILEGMTLGSRGFIIDAELLYKTACHGYRLKEVPVTSRPRQKGVSTVGIHRVWETVKELMRLMSTLRN